MCFTCVIHHQVLGLCILDEWENFLERIGRGGSGDTEIQESSTDALELRFWASYRGQTLARTGLIHRIASRFIYPEVNF